MGRRTAEQLAQTRRDIVAAAEHLFAEHGFAGTQIADIAARAGVGIGAFYRQFPDKQALLGHVLGRLFADIRSRNQAARVGILDRSPLEQVLVIQQTYETVFDTFAAHPDLGKVLLRSGYGMALDVDRLVWDSIDEMAGDVASDLIRAQDQGLLELKRPKDFGDALVGMILQLAHRMLVDGSPNAKEAAQFCTQMTFGAMLAFMPPDVFAQLAPLIPMIKAEQFPEQGGVRNTR